MEKSSPPNTLKNTSAPATQEPSRRLCVAPMMAWTDRHDRYFLRLISSHALLYTEMVTTGALIYGKKFNLLDFNDEEHPVALQLGGSDPADLATCAKYGQDAGYDEINLNCGCPSERVQKGSFGACLMREPDLVADCVDAMKQAVNIPVTLKTRIGVDDQDSYDFLTDFVGKTSEKGCNTFIIHARKAWLKGLSPAQNRSVPPLKWETVYRLKQDFPHLEIILNGGINKLEQLPEIMRKTDGVMIGREAYQNPYFLAGAETALFGTQDLRDMNQVVEDLIPYIDAMQEQQIPVKDITRHIHGLFQGIRGARAWRRHLSEESHKTGATSAVVREALKKIDG